jgi:2-polyprenyl-3-methyl-5-hydroxy-6-metoxy-1,4-benzoquinol methylase
MGLVASNLYAPQLVGASISSNSEHVDDRAGKEYWDRAWEKDDPSEDIAANSTSIWAHRDQLFHRLFRRLIGTPPHLTVVELGCARSAWLPYFAREFHATVAGLDYSALGATQAAARLRQHGIEGDVRCADLFDPPSDWCGEFDVVVWFGVAEHFEDTTHAVRAAARLLKPGGLLITEIPNMSGLVGWVQRVANRPVYDIHVPHSREDLRAHHVAAGLDVICAEYVVPTDFGVVEMGGAAPGFGRVVKEKLLYILRLFTGCVWWLDRHVTLPATRAMSGFIVVGARKPQ